MYIRWTQGDGRGLLNNLGLDFDRLTDNQYFEYEQFMVRMQQPPRGNTWGSSVIFVFTDEASEKRWKRLIALAKKMSRSGTKRIKLDPSRYDVVWESSDGQLGIKEKELSKRL